MSLITVLLPTYNVEKYIEECLHSLELQTFKDFTVLIIDDHSTDKTEEIINHNILKYNWLKKITKPSHLSRGISSSLNYLLQFVNTQYIARMDGDDIALPHRFEKQLQIVESGYSCVLANALFIKNNINYSQGTLAIPCFKSGELKKELCWGNNLPHDSLLIRTVIMKEFLYKEIGAEDYDLWCRMLLKDIKIYFMHEPLLLIRVHQESSTHKARIFHLKSYIDIRKNMFDATFGKAHPLFYSSFPCQLRNEVLSIKELRSFFSWWHIYAIEDSTHIKSYLFWIPYDILKNTIKQKYGLIIFIVFIFGTWSGLKFLARALPELLIKKSLAIIPYKYIKSYKKLIFNDS